MSKSKVRNLRGKDPVVQFVEVLFNLMNADVDVSIMVTGKVLSVYIGNSLSDYYRFTCSCHREAVKTGRLVQMAYDEKKIPNPNTIAL
mgnify:CR=1 FL=1